MEKPKMSIETASQYDTMSQAATSPRARGKPLKEVTVRLSRGTEPRARKGISAEEEAETPMSVLLCDTPAHCVYEQQPRVFLLDGDEADYITARNTLYEETAAQYMKEGNVQNRGVQTRRLATKTKRVGSRAVTSVEVSTMASRAAIYDARSEDGIVDILPEGAAPEEEAEGEAEGEGEGEEGEGDRPPSPSGTIADTVITGITRSETGTEIGPGGAASVSESAITKITDISVALTMQSRVPGSGVSTAVGGERTTQRSQAQIERERRTLFRSPDFVRSLRLMELLSLEGTLRPKTMKAMLSTFSPKLFDGCTDDPDYTDPDTLVCPLQIPALYGAYPLSYIAPEGVEHETPSIATTRALEIVMSGLYPSAWIKSLLSGGEYDSASRANVVCALTLCVTLLGLLAVWLYTNYGPNGNTRRLLRDCFRWVDTSKSSMVNVTKVYGRYGMKRRNEGDEYIDNEYRGTIMGGCVTSVLYVIAAFTAVWTLYVCMHTDAIPTLPEDIYTELTPDQPPYLRQRDVQTVPYTSLPTEPGQYLNSAISSRDNLYVIETTTALNWGTVCIPSDPVFLEMSLSDKIRLIFSTSAGTADLSSDPKAVLDPTTWAELRDSGSLSIETTGCLLTGGQACSEDLSNVPDLASAIAYKPLLSYGCYLDEDAIYHHMSVITLPWVFGYPSFDDMTFEVSQQPSDSFPYFGLAVGATRTHVFPSYLNQYLQVTADETQPLIKHDTIETGLFAVGVGYMFGLPYPQCHWGEVEEAQAATILGNVQTMLGDVSLNPFDPVVFGDDGMQTAESLSALWDPSQQMSYTVGPLPTVVAEVPTSTEMFGNSCFEQNGIYFGELCEALKQGVGFTADPDIPYMQGVPLAVLCGTQHFTVDSQITHVPGWCADPSSSEGQFGDCDSDRVFYAGLASSITGEPTVCPYESVDIMEKSHTVSIRHRVSSQVSEVTFHNLEPVALLGDVVLLLVSLFGFQTLLESVASAVRRLMKIRKASRRKRRGGERERNRAREEATYPAERVPSHMMGSVTMTPNPMMGGTAVGQTGV
ncbi:hypothetical protein KIPB_002155 [Kipferlia bialata]|uniref:Uncharacterized protein n=1 Tax=Kipferlia bialata TaxID=797122 RepID=A0A9K3CT59_9EUKA|nr:hypothetical protein KIPB_002155 [Kipferlia bialata]|eukprot:g2155.t1